MIVRHLDEAASGPRRIAATGWESIRLCLRADGMGFSFHITTIHEGAELSMHYQHHLESVYCMQGEGEIVDIAGGDIHPIRPGTVYLLDQNDRHILRARTEMKMACVFNPPLHGTEVHNAEGAYEPFAEPVED